MEMNKRAVNISSLVLLLALLSFILEVCLYYFVPIHWVAVLAAAMISLALTHYFLETTLDYDSCFLLAAFMTIMTTAFCVVIYLMKTNEWISYDYSLLVLVAVNWLVPFGYCFVRDFMDRGPRFDDYLFFFHGMSIIFLVVYFFAVTKQFFVTPLIPPYEAMSMGAHSFIPFMATGTYLEETLSHGGDIAAMLTYIAEVVLFAVPFGFYAKVYTRQMHGVVRFLVYVSAPLLIEVVQFVTGIGRGDIDDYAFAIIGTVIGVGIYRLVAYISYEVNKREFLVDRTVSKSLLFHF